MKLTVILCLVAVALFFAGRWTAPKPGIDYQPKIDSLQRDIKARETREELAIDSMNHYRMMAETWYNEAEEAKKGKVIIRTVYKNELKKIERLNSLGIDSVFVLRYGPDSIK